jgi:hypothetical protein
MLTHFCFRNYGIQALDFIYSGENERPVRAINFRIKKQGGLGLINPIWKALMVKNMIRGKGKRHRFK